MILIFRRSITWCCLKLPFFLNWVPWDPRSKRWEWSSDCVDQQCQGYGTRAKAVWNVFGKSIMSLCCCFLSSLVLNPSTCNLWVVLEAFFKTRGVTLRYSDNRIKDNVPRFTHSGAVWSDSLSRPCKVLLYSKNHFCHHNTTKLEVCNDLLA
jgi:hypothetical protein